MKKKTLNLPILLDIADSNESRKTGLMFKKSLPDHYGMLFVFDDPHVLKFWGMNTLIPLDIGFLNEDFTMQSIKNIKPHDLSSVSSDSPCRFALETNLGFLSKYGINAGSKIKIWKDGPSYFLDLDETKKTAQAIPDATIDKIDELINEKEQKSKVLSKETFEEEPESKLLVDNEKDIKPDIKLDINKDRYNKVIDRRLSKDLQRYPKFSSFFEALKWAFQNNEVIRISYMCISGRKIVRDVEPHGLFKSRKSGRQVLITFDRNAGEPRSFIVMKVNQYSFIGRKFQKKFIYI
jgi:uncharacterized membrane protein (UPF0127 family)